MHPLHWRVCIRFLLGIKHYFTECSQFSLDDEDEHQSRTNNRQKHGNKGEIEPLTDRRQSSSNQNTSSSLQRNNDNTRTPRNQEVKRNGREVSRLTDEVELDGGSDSDELDLLPPLPTSTSKSNERKRKLKRLLQCCSPYYVRPKCTIM
jgi:hypothetical protein